MTKKSTQKILEKLVCRDIPDTRKLQQLRIDSIGGISQYEKIIREHYPKFDSAQRLVKIPETELKEIYEMAIPLTFPQCDYTGGQSNETSFSQWQNSVFQVGAMHLTTEKNLNALLKIFTSNQIPVKLEIAYGKVFDVERERRAGISVPHSWYVNNYDPHEELLRHQFVVCEQKVFGVPYYFSEEISTKEKEEEMGVCKDSFSISEKNIKQTQYHCRAFFSSPDHDRGNVFYKKYIPKMLEDKEKNIQEEWDESRRGRLNSAKVKLLKIGEPVMIYDPEWVNR